MIDKILTKIFGSKQDKDVKLLNPIVEQINEFYDSMHELTDEEIKSKSNEFKFIIKERTKELEEYKIELQGRLINEDLDSVSIQEVKDEIKITSQSIFETIEEVLNEILPEAFAVVKQTCKRLKEAKFQYEYVGQSATWDMVPYDVQLMGGIVLHQGKISEMATGEGKTLVAILPMYLNALSGKGVHLVTVNDYLAKRDCEWMKPVFDFLGIKVGAIQSKMDNEERKIYYELDIAYGTNNEFGFDYLRDNMVVEMEQMVQREHWYAIVDEVDSVLIDEARTPLIISGPVGHTDQRFEEMNPRVKKMVEAQNKMVNQLVSEAENYLKNESKENKEKAGFMILKAHRALPKHKRLAKIMQEPENMKLLKETEITYLKDQGVRMRELDEELFYTIDEKNHNVDISDNGRYLMASSKEDAEMFVIPDIATELSALEGNESLSYDEKQKLIDQKNMLFAERSDRIHTITQLLRAYSLYEIDDEYVVQDGKVLIVDEFTGRILDGRRYSDGLHQAIEAKENVHVERDTQTLATITLQNYFKLYKKLGGMTGTAETEAAEFEKIYQLEVVVVPTNVDMIRNDEEDLIYRTKREKYNAIADEVEKLLKQGRAILVGTTSVDVSELLSKMLKRKNVPHNVLNAKQHQKEAEIVANAGKKGSVTIATNMAGRGTDIKLDNDVKKNGGLAIIGSERHEARRIDRQLRGRAGRQGDPGSSQFFISLEDELMRLFGGDKLGGILQRMKIEEGEAIQHSMMSKAVERAQKRVEENNFGVRKRLLEYDDVMNMQREVIYTRRKHALKGERLKGELFEYIEDLALEWYNTFHEDNDIKGLKNSARAIILSEPAIKNNEFQDMKEDECVEKIIEAATQFYKRKEEMLGVDFMANLERFAILQTIDEKWREHLRMMDELKEGIHLRAYGQKDPLLEYKGEAYKLFIELVKNINTEAVNVAFKYFPQYMTDEKQGRNRRDSAPRIRNTAANDSSRWNTSHSEIPSFITSGMSADDAPRAQRADTGEKQKIKTFRKTEPQIGRNDPCPCGSGKKYKQCHGKNIVA